MDICHSECDFKGFLEVIEENVREMEFKVVGMFYFCFTCRDVLVYRNPLSSKLIFSIELQYQCIMLTQRGPLPVLSAFLVTRFRFYLHLELEKMFHSF